MFGHVQRRHLRLGGVLQPEKDPEALAKLSTFINFWHSYMELLSKAFHNYGKK